MNTMHYYRSNLMHHHMQIPYMMIFNNFKQIFYQKDFRSKFCRAKSQPFTAFARLFSILFLSSILLYSNAFSLFAKSFSDQDDSEIAIEVDVTAYTHWDGGLGCPGYSPAYGQSGDHVTVCFAITNIGDSVLQNIQIVNTLSQNLTTYKSALWPGSTITLWYQGILSESLPVEVAVQASTSLEIDISPAFSAQEFMTIPIQERNPSIELNQSVYLEHDGGAGCENSSNQLEAISGQPLTYCFEVINKGDTSLDDFQLVAPLLSIDQNDLLLHSGQFPLAPSKSLIYYHQTQAVGNLKPAARIQANPIDSNGDDLPGLNNPHADSSVKIRTPFNTPGIMLVKTAYVQTSENSQCPGANLVQATNNESIAYCLEVFNTGSTYLDSIQITDPNFSLDLPLDISLAPNESQALLLPANSINADVRNTASVQGNGVDADGRDLPGLADPVHQDSAFVNIIAPALTLEKSVYLGRDGGARCPGETDIEGAHNYDITYCYVVKNIGDIDLANIQIEDPTLGVTQRDLDLLDVGEILSPDSQAIWYYETKLDGASVTPTTVSANPVDKNGQDIPHISNPSAESIAHARLSTTESGYSVRHSLYLGHDQGDSCPGSYLIAGVAANVTYCIVVTNNGSNPLSHSTFIENIPPIDKLKMKKRSSTDPLPTGESVIFYHEGIQGELAGSGISVATEQSSDGGTLGVVAQPAISLETTVYQEQNGGTFCPGGERAVGATHDRVTYCFKITNQDKTYIDQISLTRENGGTPISQDELILLHGSLPLAPQSYIIYYYHTTIEQDILDITTVTAQATDATGQTLSEIESIEATDEVTLERYVSIGDYVWYDTNANGLQDVGEEGAPGVNVTLHNAGGGSVDSIQTGSDGFFVFDEVLPNEYYLGIDLPNGYLFTQPNAATSGDQEWQDSDVDPANGRTSNFTMASGDGNLNLDAGLVEPAAIGNRVWLDENSNGIQDSDETGISNIPVELYQINSLTGEKILVNTTFTDEQGIFEFTNLQPNRYVIRVPLNLAQGYNFSPQDAGISDESDSDIDPQTGDSSETQLEPGENDSSWDIGLISVSQVSITIDKDGIEASPSQSIIYTIDYENQGDSSISNFLITKTIPIYTSFDAESSTDGWNCTNNAGQCIYSLTTVPGQEAQQLRFAVKVDAILPSSVSIVEHELSIAYRSQSMPTSVPNVTRSISSQIRFRPLQIIDLRRFSANLTDNNEILFSWELASENNLDSYQIDVTHDDDMDFQDLVDPFTTEANDSNYTYLHPIERGLNFSGISTFWLTAFDAQGNGTRYGPFTLQGSIGSSENKLYLPLILK